MLKTKNKINEVIQLNIFFDIIGIIAIVCIREFVFGSVYDMLYIPFLIVFFLDFINKFKPLAKLFELFGNHSTKMWLIHTFLCYYFYIFVKIVVYFKWGIPCLLVLIVLSLLASYGVNYFWKFLNFITTKATTIFKNSSLYKITFNKKNTNN
jgi:hypothetical protein